MMEYEVTMEELRSHIRQLEHELDEAHREISFLNEELRSAAREYEAEINGLQMDLECMEHQFYE